MRTHQMPDLSLEDVGIDSPVGTVISVGRTVISYTHQHSGGQGMYPHGVCIAYKGEGHHPYVVWTAIYDDNRQVWFAEDGDYCVNITEATERYNARGGL